MCCENPVLPAEVAAELASYRSINPGTEWWGEWTSERKDFFLVALPVISPINFLLFSELSEAAPTDVEEAAVWLRGDDAGAILSDGMPQEESTHFRRGSISASGDFAPGAQPPMLLIDEHPHAMLVLLTSDSAESTELSFDGEAFTLAPFATVARRVDIHAGREVIDVVTNGVRSEWRLARTVPTSTLALRSEAISRWSVLDDAGGAWFPGDALEKWDDKKRPYFHAREVTLVVPATTIAVTCARGLEFTPSHVVVSLNPGESREVELVPKRWIDSRELGWYGGDLHIHMNYSGQMTVTPETAQLMQQGEDLALANFVAANLATSVIYDGAALREYAGRDLPDFGGHSHGDDAAHTHTHTPHDDDAHAHHHDGDEPHEHPHPHVSRIGVEYRNDLLGHMNALGVDSAPTILATGFPISDYPDDWPANLVAVNDLAIDRSGVVSYCHPVRNDAGLREGDGPEGVFDPVGRMFHTIRTVEARELVADVVLAPVSGMDVLSNLDNEAAAVLLRRIVGAGSRIAATAGTDVMLSVKEHGSYSNPPGWGRMYAHASELTVPAYQDAIRTGRTFVTNGPWLTLEVEGHGIGDTLDVAEGTLVHGLARSTGGAAQTLRVWTDRGVIAQAVGDGLMPLSVDFEFVADHPSFVVIEALGSADPSVYGDNPFALTSPVYITVDGVGVLNAADIEWCLRWLDLLEDLINQHGFYQSEAHRLDVIDVVHRARAVYTERLSRAVR